MLNNELYVADKNMVLALWLHKLSVDQKDIIKIVLKNDFLQKWLGKDRIHDRALNPLENALKKYFRSIEYRGNRGICGSGKVLVLPCEKNCGKIIRSDQLDLLNVPRMAKDIGLNCYSSN